MKLEIKNLTTGYGDTKIIENLNLTIPEGKVTALIGANGCGKSTLLKTICRIIRPMDGDVLLDGKSIGSYGSRELAKKVAILPQNPTAPGEISVRVLVMYGRAPHHGSLFARTTKEDKEIVEWALKETELLQFADRGITNMSGGQRQRAWIAMAIAQNTDILFLDEPTSFLNEAARFADNLVAMKDGKIQYEGTPHTIFHNEMLKDVFGVDSTIMNDPKTDRPFCIPYSTKNYGHTAREV